MTDLPRAATAPAPPPRAPTASAMRPATAPVDPADLEPMQERPSRMTLPRRLTPLPTATAVSARFMLELTSGSPVGEYEIQQQIGEGAMGTVYSAIQPLIGKIVAIKVLKPELCANEASVNRFVQEAQAVNRIGHPNIVDVFSLGELPDGRAYMVMEWLRGEDLKTRLSRGPMAVVDACDILDGIARALDAAHAKDIVHRDLKPDNVFLHQVESGPTMVKLLDFGIAKLMRSGKSLEKTQTGNMLGTPRYISPEQARGIDVTHISDIYSLGIMAYEMLAGRPPFQGETAMDLVVKHLSEAPPPLSQFARVPRSLEDCVMSMIAKDPAQRPSLAEVRQILVDPTRKLSRPLRRSLRSKLPLVLGGVALVLASGVVAWKLVGRSGSDEPAKVVEAPPSAEPQPPPPTTTPAVASPPPVQKEQPAPPPAPPPTPATTLAIAVTGVKDAKVLVDKKPWTDGPHEIAPGAHDIEVIANRRTLKKHVTVTEGTAAVFDIETGAPQQTPVVRQPVIIRKQPPVKPPPAGDDEDALLAPKGHK